jgi:hypothetical protein
VKPLFSSPALVWRAITMSIALTLLPACGSTLRDQLHNASNASAGIIDAGTHTILALYCNQTMSAIGRLGTLASDGHCNESGPRMGSAATDAEREALVATRTRWAPVITQAEIVTHLHDVVRGLLETGVSVTDGQILAAAGSLAQAYEALRQAAITAGITPPPPFSLGAPP